MNELASKLEAREESVQFFSKNLIRKLIPASILGALTYGGLLLYSDVDAISANVRAVPPADVILAVLLSLASYALRGLRWEFYLRISKIRIPFKESVLVFLAGFAMSITPAKMGEVLKSLLLKESHDVPVAVSAPIVVAERATDLTGLLLLGGVGFWAIPGGHVPAILSIASAMVLTAMMNSRGLGQWAIRLATRLPVLNRARPKLLQAHEALVGLSGAGPTLFAVPVSFLAWGLQCACLSVLASAFELPRMTLSVALIAYSAPLLVGTLALLPGGLGLTEASMTGTLERLAGPGMTTSIAATLTILVRLVTFWMAIALGFLALSLWRWRRRAVASAASASGSA